jgi:hypothetical protein
MMQSVSGWSQLQCSMTTRLWLVPAVVYWSYLPLGPCCLTLENLVSGWFQLFRNIKSCHWLVHLVWTRPWLGSDTFHWTNLSLVSPICFAKEKNSPSLVPSVYSVATCRWLGPGYLSVEQLSVSLSETYLLGNLSLVGPRCFYSAQLVSGWSQLFSLYILITTCSQYFTTEQFVPNDPICLTTACSWLVTTVSEWSNLSQVSPVCFSACHCSHMRTFSLVSCSCFLIGQRAPWLVSAFKMG